jgi:hypothetical protein
MDLRSTRQALASDWFDTYARLGYGAKGLSFAAIGIMMARVAMGQNRERADFAGAMQTLSEEPVLGSLIIVLAIGMIGYAIWRIIEGVADLEREGNDVVGLAKRAVYVIIGLIYLFLSAYALGILFGWSTEENQVQDWTAVILGWPFGELLIGLTGVAVLIGGLIELWSAVSRKFEVELGRDDLARWERLGLLTAGIIGHGGRSLVYGAVGFFAIRAAVEFDPDEARGIADTMRELANQPYGPWLVAIGSIGFIFYGAYYCLLARHHHLPNEGLMRGRRGRDRPQPE